MGEWNEYTFRELLESSVRNGIYKKKEFHGRGCKIVNMGELFAQPRLKNIEMNRVDLSEKEKVNFLLKEGDLIFARRSLTAEGAGKCSLVQEITEHTTFESSIIRATPDHQKATSEFLYYYFNSRYGKYLLGTILRQVAVAGITGSDLMGLVLRVPPLPEQKAIASVLSSLDDKIDLLHRQNKTLEAMAETLFRQWFVEEALEDWEEKPLDEVADYLNGLACQKYPPKNDVDKLPVLKIKELKNGFTDNSDWATTDLKEDYIVQSGDIIFSWSGSLLVKIWDGRNCVLNQHLFKVTSVKYPQWFIYFWTKFHIKEFIAIAESKATTMGHIKREDLSHSMALVPADSELEHMNSIVYPLIDKIILNNEQLAKLGMLRDSLLPKLMSGEVRVENKGDNHVY